jgi:hypothetical protein
MISGPAAMPSDWVTTSIPVSARFTVAISSASPAFTRPRETLVRRITAALLALPSTRARPPRRRKGSIAGGDLLNLQSQISALPADATVAVVLESPRGSLGDGIALGKFFHRAKIISFVAPGTGCHTACSIAFLGGRNGETGKPMRIKSSNGLLGFHQFSLKFDPNKKYAKKDRDDMVLAVQDIAFALVDYFKSIDERLALFGAGSSHEWQSCRRPCRRLWGGKLGRTLHRWRLELQPVR